MDVYGLVGRSLKHSKSPDYFNERFKIQAVNAEYRLFEIEHSDMIEQIIKETPNLKGLNVTIPYKRSVARMMDNLSPEVKKTGSINTIKIIRDSGKIITEAYNTDIIGIETSIKSVVEKNKGIKALILGTGGAARTTAYVLRKLGVFYYFVSRDPKKVVHMGYNWITKDLIRDYKLIINCTPIGMFPLVDEAPQLPYEDLNSDNICFDCVYNPENTLFLKRASLNGSTVISGKQMFKVQANEAWKIWMK